MAVVVNPTCVAKGLARKAAIGSTISPCVAFCTDIPQDTQMPGHNQKLLGCQDVLRHQNLLLQLFVGSAPKNARAHEQDAKQHRLIKHSFFPALLMR